MSPTLRVTCFRAWLFWLVFRKLTDLFVLLRTAIGFGVVHRLYDQITEEAPEYYLYQAELQLLKTHSREIAAQMGFPSPSPSSPSPRSPQGPQGPQSHQTPPPPREDPPPQNDSHSPRVDREDDGETDEKWGDVKVGRWNGGVNAEEGLDGEREKEATGNEGKEKGKGEGEGKGWDIVELGAG